MDGEVVDLGADRVRRAARRCRSGSRSRRRTRPASPDPAAEPARTALISGLRMIASTLATRKISSTGPGRARERPEPEDRERQDHELNPARHDHGRRQSGSDRSADRLAGRLRSAAAVCVGGPGSRISRRRIPGRLGARGCRRRVRRRAPGATSNPSSVTSAPVVSDPRDLSSGEKRIKVKVCALCHP